MKRGTLSCGMMPHTISHMAKSKLTPEQTNLLNEILEMFRAFDAAKARLKGESINWAFVTFQGFDTNDPYESDLVLHGGYPESHRKMLPHYRRLLAAWHGCSDKKNLTRDDVLRIIQTARPTR
jgi:uncharacterized protein YfbU (UPF0304 family)